MLRERRGELIGYLIDLTAVAAFGIGDKLLRITLCEPVYLFQRKMKLFI